MNPLQGPVELIQGQNYPETLHVTRESTLVRYVDGKPLKTVESEFDITANIQPLRGLDLLMVPEGDRTTEQFWLWTLTYMRPDTDRVIFSGNNYEVQTVQKWGPYYQCRIMRIDVGPNQSPPL